MGGDHGPAEIVPGALHHAAAHPEDTVLLVGDPAKIGAIAGTIGALGAVVLSWAVANYVLELEWQAAPLLTTLGIAATAVFVAIVGVAASWDVLRHKPLATLRAE